MAHAGGIVEAVPINSTTEPADRQRTLRDLDEWLAENPEHEATPLGPNGT